MSIKSGLWGLLRLGVLTLLLGVQDSPGQTPQQVRSPQVPFWKGIGMSRRSGSRITVRKTLHLKDAQVTGMAYMSPTQPILAEALALSGKRQGEVMRRVSADNGQSWSVLPDTETGYLFGCRKEPRGDRLVTRSTAAAYLLPDLGILVEFLAETESRLNEVMSFGPEAAAQEQLEFRTGRIFYRFSRDEGKTWGATKQLIQEGKEYDAVHWAAGVWYGKNGVSPTCLTPPLRLSDGALLLTVYVWCLGEDGGLLKRVDRFGDMTWPTSAAASLRGEWNAARGDFDWQISPQVIAPEFLSHGLDECEAAEVDGGKLMMVIRGGACGWQSFPGVKFFAISRDKGRTWGPPVPLTYPDGSLANSPASLPNLFRSSKNGKLYMIANILPEPCRQGDPRYPLVIAEVDPTYFWVLPETVTVIADRQKGQSDRVRFSNWLRIEDRTTGNPVIYLSAGRVEEIIPGTPGAILPHSYRYEITLPD